MMILTKCCRIGQRIFPQDRFRTDTPLALAFTLGPVFSYVLSRRVVGYVSQAEPLNKSGLEK